MHFDIGIRSIIAARQRAVDAYSQQTVGKVVLELVCNLFGQAPASCVCHGLWSAVHIYIIILR
jgi:hypothetical protein